MVVGGLIALLGLSAIADAVDQSDNQQTAIASAAASAQRPHATTSTPTTGLPATTSTMAPTVTEAPTTTSAPTTTAVPVTTAPPTTAAAKAARAATSTTKPPARPSTITSGATAECEDGTLSYSAHRRGTCSHHGGVAKWLKDVPA